MDLLKRLEDLERWARYTSENWEYKFVPDAEQRREEKKPCNYVGPLGYCGECGEPMRLFHAPIHPSVEREGEEKIQNKLNALRYDFRIQEGSMLDKAINELVELCRREKR